MKVQKNITIFQHWVSAQAHKSIGNIAHKPCYDCLLSAIIVRQMCACVYVYTVVSTGSELAWLAVAKALATSHWTLVTVSHCEITSTEFFKRMLLINS